MSAVYALGRNPCPALSKTCQSFETDDNAYVRRATAWSLANYDEQIVLEPLTNALDDVASRLWSSSSLLVEMFLRKTLKQQQNSF